MKYLVEVHESLARVLVVEAPTSGEAEEFVRAKYEEQDIVLDADDMIGEEDIQVLEGEVPDDFEIDYVVEPLKNKFYGRENIQELA